MLLWHTHTHLLGVVTGSAQPEISMSQWHVLSCFLSLTHQSNTHTHSDLICVARGYRIVPLDTQIGLLCDTWPPVTVRILAQRGCTRYLTVHVHVFFSIYACSVFARKQWNAWAWHHLRPWLLWALDDLCGLSEASALIWSDKRKQLHCKHQA